MSSHPKIVLLFVIFASVPAVKFIHNYHFLFFLFQDLSFGPPRRFPTGKVCCRDSGLARRDDLFAVDLWLAFYMFDSAAFRTVSDRCLGYSARFHAEHKDSKYMFCT